MLSKDERKAHNVAFWTAYGRYMQGQHSSFGTKVNWANYKTGIKDLFVRFIVDNRHIYFSIELQHEDKEIRALVFEQFEELKKLLETEMGDELIWQSQHFKMNGEEISRIYDVLEDAKYINRDNWKGIFEFMSGKIKAFDSFWYDWKDTFVHLCN